MKKIKLLLLLFIMIIIGIGGVKAVYLSSINENEQITDVGYVFSTRFSGKYTLSPALNNWKMGKCGSGTKETKNARGCYASSKAINYANLTPGNSKKFLNNESLYIVYYNVGTYYNVETKEKTDVDMKIAITNIIWNENTNASFGFATNSIGVENASTGSKTPAEFIYHIYYYKHGTNQAVQNMKSIINFTDLDYGEQLSIHENNFVKGYRLKTESYIGTPGRNSYYHVYGDEISHRIYIKTNQKLVLDCKNQADGREVDCSTKGGIKKSYLEYNSKSLSKNGISNIEYETFFKKAGSVSVLLNGSTISFGWSGYFTSLQEAPFSKNLESNPYKMVWYKGNNYADKTIDIGSTKNYDVNYTFEFTVPNQDKAWYYSSWTITDKLPSELELKNKNSVYRNVTVKDKLSNNDVTWFFRTFNYDTKCESSTKDCNNGSITFDSDTNTLKLNAGSYYLNKSGNKFYGRTYVVSVKTKLKSSEIKLDETINKKIKNKVEHSYSFIKDGTRYETSSNEVSFNIKNTPASPPPRQSCEEKLNDIKTANYNSNPAINNATKIFNLRKLYNEEKEYDPSHDYTGLFNFKMDGSFTNNIDFSKTVCDKLDDGCTEKTVKDSRVADLPSNGNKNRLQCSGNNLIESGKSSDSRATSDTICYAGDENNNFGSYYSEKLNAYCKVSYEYNLPFTNETVKSGDLLWSNKLGQKINDGYMDLKITCFNSYDMPCSDLSKKSSFILEPEDLQDILPSLQLEWQFNNKYMPEYLHYSLDNVKLEKDYFYNEHKNDENLLYPDYYSGKVDGKDICFARWGADYKVDVNYNTDWYLDSGSGKYYKENNGQYRYAGSGLPVTLLDDELKENLKKEEDASLYIQTLSGELVVDCPYTILNKYFDGNTPKINFRTIDTSDPFPGLSGEGRLTGSNWCLSSSIGTKKYDDDGHPYIIGDINGDGKINSADLTSFDSSKLAADIDGNNEVSSEDCGVNPKSDYCTLKNYIKKSDNNKYLSYVSNCGSKNNLVKNYIINKPDSSSVDKPMYSFTLNAADIKNIREYNKSNAYADFKLECDGGYNCKSTFLTDLIYNKTINGKSISTPVTQDNSKCFGTRNPNGGNEMCTN